MNPDAPDFEPPEGEPRNIAGSGKPARERIIDALLAILPDKSYERITLAEVAATAGVTLADMRGEFGSTLSILTAHMKEVDRAVLAGAEADDGMDEEPVRERLFDALMRRFEILAPHREAIRSLMESARRNPPLALALNGASVQSMQWMLAAAGVSNSGPKGMIRAQGLAMLYACAMRTWLKDYDPGLARTMAALDRELARGHRMAGLLDGLFAIPARACRIVNGGRRRHQRRRMPRDGDEHYAV